MASSGPAPELAETNRRSTCLLPERMAIPSYRKVVAAEVVRSPVQIEEAASLAEKQDAQHEDGGKGEPTGQRHRWPLIAVAVAVVVALIGGGIYWFLTRNEITTDDAYTDGRAVMIAAHVAGYVRVLAVNDNQFVHAGDLLVEIERKDYVSARDQAVGQLASVKAQLDNAQVTFDKAKTIYPAQMKQAEAQLAQARAQLYQTEAEYHRQHTVVAAATSQQNIDNATAAFNQAQAQVRQAEAQLAQAALVDQNIAQTAAQFHQMEGQVEQSQANLEQAEINLGYTRITAPQDGWVTRRNVELGNYVQQGAQILAVVVPEVWVTANFKETQLDRMRPGQPVRIEVDAYPHLKLEGHVDSIQKGSGSRFTAFPPENATGNFVKIVQRVPVKILIDKGLDPNLPLPLGLSVEPTVTVQ